MTRSGTCPWIAVMEVVPKVLIIFAAVQVRGILAVFSDFTTKPSICQTVIIARCMVNSIFVLKSLSCLVFKVFLVVGGDVTTRKGPWSRSPRALC